MSYRALKLSFLVFLYLGLQIVTAGIGRADEPVPMDAVAQVISVSGKAEFAASHDELMRYERKHRFAPYEDLPQFQLVVGQWLQKGNAVIALENSSVVLRWRDGHTAQLGPRAEPVEMTVQASETVRAASASKRTPLLPQPLAAFMREHWPLLLFGFGALLVVLPLFRRSAYVPGTFAHLVGIALFVCVTIPVTLLLLAAQLGRMAWYVPPIPGETWSGAAANFAQLANIAALLVVLGGLVALWGLSIAFVTGRSERLGFRTWIWWACAAAMLSIAVAAYLAPYAPNLDFNSEWYHFWRGWQRYYAIGPWLLLPFAQLVACVRSPSPADQQRMRWQGLAASAVLVVFIACYALGYNAEYDATNGVHNSKPGSREEAHRWLCAVPNVFEGSADHFRIAASSDCTPRAAGDTSGFLQACEAAIVDVHVDKVLRSANLQTGQTVSFAIAHARVKLDGADGLESSLAGRHLLFQTRDDTIDGHSVQVSAARSGDNRLSPLGFNNDGDDTYAAGVLAQCRT